MLWVVVALICIPVLEAVAFAAVANALGDVALAIVVLIVVSAIGAWVAKRQGVAATRQLREAFVAGRRPGAELIEPAVIFVAGILLLIPGFVTDAVGALLLVPPLRRLVVQRGGDALRARIDRRFPVAQMTFGGAGGPSGARPGTGWRPPGTRGPGSPTGADPDIIDVEGDEVDPFGPPPELPPRRP